MFNLFWKKFEEINVTNLTGKFYKNHPKVIWEEIYINGSNISIITKEDFNFFFKITPGEDQILNKEDKVEILCRINFDSKIINENSSHDLNIFFNPDEQFALSWSSEKYNRFLFIFEEKTNKKSFDSFLRNVAGCIWKSINKVEDVMEEKCEVLKIIKSFDKKEIPFQQHIKEKSNENQIKIIEKKNPFVINEIGNPPSNYCVEFRTDLYKNLDNIFTLLYQDVGIGIRKLSENQPFLYRIYVRKGPVCHEEKKYDNLLLEVNINDDLQPCFNFYDLTFVFYVFIECSIKNFQFKFNDKDSFGSFRDVFIAFNWEFNHKLPFTSLSKSERVEILTNYAQNTTYDIDMYDLNEKLKTLSVSNSHFNEDDEYASKKSQKIDQKKYTFMTQSLIYDATFAVREDQADVFIPYESEMRKNGSIKFRDSMNLPFCPQQIMTHHKDSSLLALNSKFNKSIFHIDLERPDIVEEWSTGTHCVDKIFQKSKYNQNCIVNVLNEQGIFMLDPRLPGNKTIPTRERFFSRGTSGSSGLNCAATSADGDIVIGSKRGDVRLFSNKIWEDNKNIWKRKDCEDWDLIQCDSGQGLKLNATTKLPSKGSTITSIDITQDGKIVLYTTKTFIIVFSTIVPSTGQSGFRGKGMGKNKPNQIQLRLLFEHVRELGDVNFTPAKFNTGLDDERFIVSSTGSWIITWAFTYKNDQLIVSKDYTMKKYKQNVVAEEFRHNKSNEIVVLLENGITMAKKI